LIAGAHAQQFAMEWNVGSFRFLGFTGGSVALLFMAAEEEVQSAVAILHAWMQEVRRNEVFECSPDIRYEILTDQTEFTLCDDSQQLPVLFRQLNIDASPHRGALQERARFWKEMQAALHIHSGVGSIVVPRYGFAFAVMRPNANIPQVAAAFRSWTESVLRQLALPPVADSHGAVPEQQQPTDMEVTSTSTPSVQKPPMQGEISFVAGKVLGQGAFGVVFQATVVGTDEVVAIKKVLQDRRFRNRELQIMQSLSHPNVVSLKHFFYSHGEQADQVCLCYVVYASMTLCIHV